MPVAYIQFVKRVRPTSFNSLFEMRRRRRRLRLRLLLLSILYLRCVLRAGGDVSLFRRNLLSILYLRCIQFSFSIDAHSRRLFQFSI